MVYKIKIVRYNKIEIVKKQLFMYIFEIYEAKTNGYYNHGGFL